MSKQRQTDPAPMPPLDSIDEGIFLAMMQALTDSVDRLAGKVDDLTDEVDELRKQLQRTPGRGAR